MKLGDILRTPGVHVWAFTRTTNMTTLSEATKRIQGYIKQSQFTKIGVRVRCEGRILVNPKPPYDSEAALIVEVRHQ